MPDSESDAGSVTLHGDTARRVTVPLPRSLPELHYHANRYFGQNRGRPRLFHNGDRHISQHHHVNRMKDGDTVVVEGQIAPEREEPALTMHQTDFVKHPLESKRSMVVPERSVLLSAPFDANSSYKMDFVKHPPGNRKPVSPLKDNLTTSGRPDGMTGKSTYHSHFPWHDSEPRSAFQPVVDVFSSNAPFDGSTSYNLDFVRHENVRPRSAAPLGRPQPRGETKPFEATTTYNNDFQRNMQTARTMPVAALKPSLTTKGAPFQGSSEYKREYVELKSEQRPVIHLEPEHRREARPPTRPRSTPGGARRPRVS